MTTSPPRAPGRTDRTPSTGRPHSTARPETPTRLGALTTRIQLGRSMTSESANYFLLLGVTLFMVVFGLVMVLSSSAVESHNDSDNFFSRFWSQGAYALVGLPLMFVVSRIPRTFWKKSIWFFLAAACFLQVLVLLTPLGMEIGGNRNWLKIGSLTVQPSEAIKLALVVWLGVVLARKRDVLDQWKHVAIPVVPVAGGAVALVTLGGDLGTTMIMAALILGALFFAGVRLRYLATGVVFVAIAAVIVAMSSASRLGRIAALFGGSSAANPDVNWQIDNGFYALASGGVFGVGLGNSHSKWSWLPAADTDFIFAIIGEELGLIGAVVVLLLFVLLAVVFLRIIHASTDPFARVTTAAIMVWLIGQAFVNIAVVLGVIPVLGVPLPLISAGGTAMISSMIAIGIVLSFARQSHRDSLATQDADRAGARR
ncbi:putative lipid II flippase FtsW [Leifsonia shinshuensis]|uniref:putative lipid II flippase FtsW n=1 Tax=Leifsonia shinshuensis TaxID=150026 RepID=UPI002862D9F3|nr:putative lipid II flippase FtsW [Leifsonia shinshuensis]MDR6970901.1 UDP-N-acetylglucosamine--N-acetylmuramyl-(pentapeptide) pyrophosphoryl-undecaprenol N-acetylglucosamine transferase/cell division protein FtsW [Leifsonia shinshuensis]